MLGPDPATLRAVEAAAQVLSAPYDPDEADVAKTIAALAAYHAALGEDVRVTRVERCLQNGRDVK